MASILSVEQLRGLSSGDNPNTITLPTGQTLDFSAGTLTMPAGHVIQTVYGTTTTQVISASGTQIDTGLTASITPSSASNKILVLVANRIFSQPGTPAVVNLLRSATSIFGVARYGLTDNASAGSGNYFVTTILDSPSTTSAITYKTQFSRASGSGSIYAQLDSARSTITLMEISG